MYADTASVAHFSYNTLLVCGIQNVTLLNTFEHTGCTISFLGHILDS